MQAGQGNDSRFPVGALPRGDGPADPWHSPSALDDGHGLVCAHENSHVPYESAAITAPKFVGHKVQSGQNNVTAGAEIIAPYPSPTPDFRSCTPPYTKQASMR